MTYFQIFSLINPSSPLPNLSCQITVFLFFFFQTKEIEAVSFHILLIHIGWLSCICTSLGFALLWMNLQILLKKASFFSCAIHSILFLSKDTASNSSVFFLIVFSWDYRVRRWELGRPPHCSFSHKPTSMLLIFPYLKYLLLNLLSPLYNSISVLLLQNSFKELSDLSIVVILFLCSLESTWKLIRFSPLPFYQG